MKRPYPHRPWLDRAPSAPLSDPAPPQQPVRTEPIDVGRLPIDWRMRIADDYAAAHPGHPISAMLRELFPELKQ